MKKTSKTEKRKKKNKTLKFTFFVITLCKKRHF